MHFFKIVLFCPLEVAKERFAHKTRKKRKCVFWWGIHGIMSFSGVNIGEVKIVGFNVVL